MNPLDFLAPLGSLPALAYFALMLAFGDLVSRRFFKPVWRPQRLATAFLVGLILATWLTYLVSYVFSSTLDQPLILGDGVTSALMLGAIVASGLVPRLRARGATLRAHPGQTAALEVRPGEAAGMQPAVDGGAAADAQLEPAEGILAVPGALVSATGPAEQPIDDAPPSPVAEASSTTDPSPDVMSPEDPGPRPSGMPWSERWDWLLLVAMGALFAWMAYSTYRFVDGQLLVAGLVWSDFGPTSAISQSFALGHNFPTEYPHFAGFPIIYHFMFWFQVGNLTLLGFDPAWALNLLSVASVVSMLALVMALGRRVFASAAVGRIGAGLFFFHGTLNLVPYLATFTSVSAALEAIPKVNNFLPSVFPYRGDSWGIWAQIVFVNQRHLASAIGILLVVLLFLVERLQARSVPGPGVSEPPVGPSLPVGSWRWLAQVPRMAPRRSLRTRIHELGLPGYLASGAILGLLPMWNGPVFIASAAILGSMLVLFPNRLQMLSLAAVAAAFSVPQLLALRPESLSDSLYNPTFHFGYVVEDPTLPNVAAYLGWSFGLKLYLAAIALLVGTGLQRRLFVAVTSSLAVAFLFQLSVEMLGNHKFLNVWLVVVNLFAAHGVVRLWTAAREGMLGFAARWVGRIVSVGLVATIVVGGIIDLMPFANAPMIGRTLAGDRLFDWVVEDTKRTDTFLTAAYVSHPILLAGRRIFYGYQYFTWGAGYPLGAREPIYKRMLGERDPALLLSLLRRNGISYVAIDDGLRDEFKETLNEAVYQSHFATVFTDPEGKYGHIAIYRVDPSPPGTQPLQPGGDMLTGGAGSRPAQFAGPRGIAVDPAGEEVLIADTGNDRIQWFTLDGTFVRAFGATGQGPGQFDEPNGVAVDSRGHLFVTDAANHRLQEFDAHQALVREWRGPDPGFYGPRDIAVGLDGTLFIVDQGRGRVVKLGIDGSSSAFGSLGSGPGQLRDPTGLAVSEDRVYVADSANGRIVVFSPAGAFVRSQLIPEWQKTLFQFPDVTLGPNRDVLYASSPATNEIIVLDLELNRLGTLKSPPGERFEGPSAMALRPSGGLYVIEYGANRVSLLTSLQP